MNHKSIFIPKDKKCDFTGMEKTPLGLLLLFRMPC